MTWEFLDKSLLHMVNSDKKLKFYSVGGYYPWEDELEMKRKGVLSGSGVYFFVGEDNFFLPFSVIYLNPSAETPLIVDVEIPEIGNFGITKSEIESTISLKIRAAQDNGTPLPEEITATGLVKNVPFDPKVNSTLYLQPKPFYKMTSRDPKFHESFELICETIRNNRRLINILIRIPKERAEKIGMITFTCPDTNQIFKNFDKN